MTRRCFAQNRVRRPTALAAALALLVLAGCDSEPSAPLPGPDQPQHLPTATIGVGQVSLVVEVADSEAERQKGMMFRRRLADDVTMLALEVTGDEGEA